MKNKAIAIIGGGPAGLMAAEILSAQDLQVKVYERKASVGRKFLMAGRGGLNLTHSEDLEIFIEKYGSKSEILREIIHEFTPQKLREWCENLGEKTFIGSSGRIFPESLKASPLLRSWITRLENQGVQFMLNHEWMGWNNDALIFRTLDGNINEKPDATLLALGGASWPRLGSDGSWVYILKSHNIQINSLKSANCGFHVEWSDIFRARFAGKPLKSVTVSFKDKKISGEMMITDKGVEGGVIYALSSSIRDEIEKSKHAYIEIDLKPDLSLVTIEERLKKPQGRESFSNHLRKTLSLSPISIGLLMESTQRERLSTFPPKKIAKIIKHYPLKLNAPFSIDRAISTAGGIKFESLDENLMLLNKPGVFAAGEMLDWEAPTGGYLLQASFATGARAAQGIIKFLSR